MTKKLDASVINKAIASSVPLTLKTYKLPKNMETYIEKVLGVFLEKFGQADLADRISYCMKELAVNAKKANTKRVFFSEKDLDINNSEDYSIGMKTFKEETIENIDYWLEKQKRAGLYIKIVFHSTPTAFNLYIKNNVLISRKEQARISDRILKARTFDTIEEAMISVIDDSEGAGLGLVILVLMLKKIGLNDDAFDIKVVNDETVARITIPFEQIHEENLNELAEEIVAEIETLPQFPDNVVYIQKLINDPDSELMDIARQISLDPSLTADLLKTVNSAQFMLPQRVDNISKAVRIIGLRGISNMLLSCGTQKVLKTDQKQLWEHSRQVAFFSYNLAKNFRKKSEILDDAYVGGILHDIGKIVFSNVHPNLLNKINKFCTEKSFNSNIMEELSAGLNHAMIGGKIAKKWKFPDSLIAIITYHHNPEQAPKEYRDIVNIVYLADAMSNFLKGDISFEQINPKILNEFGFENKKQFTNIIDKLTSTFVNEAYQDDI